MLTWHRVMTDTYPMSNQGWEAYEALRSFGLVVERRVHWFGPRKATDIVALATDEQIERFYDHQCP